MIRAGVVGSRFAGSLHAESLQATGRVEIAAVASPSNAAALAGNFGAAAYPSVEAMLESERLDVVSLAIPNKFHADAAVAAARAGAHVICDKPLAQNLADADRMISACAEAGVHLLYGEELCFAPRYRRVKQLIAEGAFGKVFSISHRERHDGPHSRWFYDPDVSGGGALLDMACHGIELTRWLLDKTPVESVFARLGNFRHVDEAVEDHAVVSLRFADGTLATIEGSWAVSGGIDERLEVVGDGGSVVADLARGGSMLVHSDQGFGYAAEKAGDTRGWSHVSFAEAWQWGWPQQFAHFVDVIEGKAKPEETGADGKATLEIVLAAYQSAATGADVSLPFSTDVTRPVHLWRP
ncbi:MAG: Gfo/Idh/MocA family oxidoreductase [Acidimicrobiia bacterium]|nr:Gfo/Idh/MocA family oxidoreductase [Acidimicrobiia bacterium]